MTVYVVQDQKMVDTSNGSLKSKYDFTPAERFGKLDYLLNSSASPFNLEPVIDRLHQKLESFGPDDFLLLTGNPVLIGLAVCVASYYNNGCVKMLQWSGAKRLYIPVSAENIVVGC